MKKKVESPYGLGRRKAAVVQVLLTGTAEQRTINGLEFMSYFPTISMQTIALRPLDLAGQMETTGFKAKASGGGKQSQADALRLAIARALVDRDPALRKQLKDAGTLTRDARVKERKKFGLKRARRAPQFSKR